MNEEKIKEAFGFDPKTIGLRYRSHAVLDRDNIWENMAKEGYLSVCARDGASNEPDCTVGKHPNYIGTFSDDFDHTYRYYIFRPLGKKGEKND